MFLSYLKYNHPEAYAMLGLKRPDILEMPIDAVILESVVTWLIGEALNNSSTVDRLWSFLPTLYTGYFAFLPLFSWAPADLQAAGLSNRALLMFATQVLWSWRLSYNTWRRGLFGWSDEDYRWAFLRKYLPGILYKIFNLTFIAFIQHFLLFSVGLASYSATIQPRGPLLVSDYIMAGVCVATLLLEFTADNTQWYYQNYKHSGGKRDPNPWPFASLNWTKGDADRGFVAEGLWSVSRHPNFLCEQLFWFWTTLFPVLAEPRGLSSTPITFIPYLPKTWSVAALALQPDTTPFWHIVPALCYSSLFVASTMFTEHLTKKNYPSYRTYQRRVGTFSPATTFLKGLYLSAIGRKAEVDYIIWGGGAAKVNADGKRDKKE